MHTFEPLEAELFDQTLEGVVETAIAGHHPGQVKTLGVTWTARLCVPDPRYVLSPGTPVAIVGRRGNTVLVLPY